MSLHIQADCVHNNNNNIIIIIINNIIIIATCGLSMYVDINVPYAQ